MKFKYVVAIIPPEAVEPLERKLRSARVGGITLTKVKGFGEYKNFYTSDLLSNHTKVEIFAEESKLDSLLDALLESAASDLPGSGIVAVIPVDKFLHLRTGTESLPAPGRDGKPDEARQPA